MAEDLRILGTNFNDVTGIVVTDTNLDEQTYGPTITIINQDKTVTPSESQQVVTYDSGYSGLGEVTVNAISSSYVGSEVPRRNSANLSTSGATVTAPAGYYENEASKIIPSGTTTPQATKSTVSNNSITVTPSVNKTAGYINDGSVDGTPVTVSASELVSGTKDITANGNGIDVTTYSSVNVNVPTGGDAPLLIEVYYNVSQEAWYVSRTYSEIISADYIAFRSSDPSVVVNGYVDSSDSSFPLYYTVAKPEFEYDEDYSGSMFWEYKLTSSRLQLLDSHFIPEPNLEELYVTQNGVYTPSSGYTGIGEIEVDVAGGGGSGLKVASTTGTVSSETSYISFNNLLGEPTSFVIYSTHEVPTSGSAYIASVIFDGTNLFGDLITNTSNSQVSYNGAVFTKTYNNGTLTVSFSGIFTTGSYSLIYTYGGSTSDIQTSDVQVGSGATSITFTGLTDEPSYFSCAFKSNFGTSSGYQRVITIGYDGAAISGLSMDSSAKYSSSNYSYTYNNGSLTISSVGTNAGGYFHQPGYYQLTYAIDSDASKYQTKSVTITPSTSQQTQTVTADTGYDALRAVNVTVEAVSYSTIYTGSSAPSAATGVNGDIYLQI